MSLRLIQRCYSAGHTRHFLSLTNMTLGALEAEAGAVPLEQPKLLQFPALKASSLRGEQKASEELILCLRSNADVFMSLMNISAFGAIT